MNVGPSRPANGPALIFELAEPMKNPFIVCYNNAALTRRDRFIRRERETAGLSKCPQAAIIESGAKAFRSILDHSDPVFGSDIDDFFDLRGAPADVNRHDG